MRVRALLATTALALGAIAPASAATVSQSLAFSQSNESGAAPPAVEAKHSESQSLHFEGFDASLGTLTGARWQLDSTEQFYSAFLGSPTSAVFVLRNAEGHVQAAGQDLPQLGFSSSGVFPCGTNGLCNVQQDTQQAFDFAVEAASLAPFLAPGGVDATLASNLLVAIIPANPLGGYILGGEFHWNGALTLTYQYEAPAGPIASAPEPRAWALMIAGFGLAGGALRRRPRKVGHGSDLSVLARVL
jgi:hypothetical protein